MRDPAQSDQVDAPRAVPVKNIASGRELGSAPSAERAAPKLAEAAGLQRLRSPDFHLLVSDGAAVDVADADRSTRVRQTGAIEIRLQLMTRDWRQVLPASRRGVEFHCPEIVAARARRIDLNDDFGPAVTVNVADADGRCNSSSGR